MSESDKDSKDLIAGTVSNPDRKPHRNYNPQITAGGVFKPPPVLNSLAHVPFNEMAFETSVESRRIDAVGFEQELLVLLTKYGIMEKPEEVAPKACTGRRISFTFPSDPKGSFAINFQQKVSHTHSEFVSVVTARGKTDTTALTYPASFNVMPDLNDIRRVFTIGSRYQPTEIKQPEIYEAITSCVSMVKGKPTVVKTFVVDGQEIEFLNAVLPADKYALLNGITDKK